MILIVGLGNWENKYLKNRHNVGFHFIDHLINKYNFTQDSKNEKKIDGYCFEANSQDLLLSLQNNFNQAQELKNKKDRMEFKFPQDEKFVLIKPKTFMNVSGKSILKYLSFNKPSLIIVAYDDIEVDIGQIKFGLNLIGSGGHNGIRSIISTIGSNFLRFRIGIKNPITRIVSKNEEKKDNNLPLADFVLSDFTEEESLLLNKVFKSF